MAKPQKKLWSFGSKKIKVKMNKAIAWAGAHYGRTCDVITICGRSVTLMHPPSGSIFTLPLCDVELLEKDEHQPMSDEAARVPICPHNNATPAALAATTLGAGTISTH